MPWAIRHDFKAILYTEELGLYHQPSPSPTPLQSVQSINSGIWRNFHARFELFLTPVLRVSYAFVFS